MIRYYLFINIEYTKIYKKEENGEISLVSFEGVTLFNNTLKYDFYKEDITIAYQDKYYMTNRFASVGEDSNCCGSTLYSNVKIGVFLLDLFNLLD